MAYPCVPLNPAWTGATRLDLRAIYQRPNGDLTTALPLRRHEDYVRKGWTYVTLADAASFADVALSLPNASHYVVGRDGDGRPTPWDVARYLADRQETQAADDAKLADLITKHGVEAVETITGRPVPERLKRKAKGTAA